jgi:hypothetical protein
MSWGNSRWTPEQIAELERQQKRPLEVSMIGPKRIKGVEDFDQPATMQERMVRIPASRISYQDVFQIPKKKRRNNPEHQQQRRFFEMIEELAQIDARYALAARRTFAIPNGGGRKRAQAGMLKAEGVKAGISDILLALARGGLHGLFIEMKPLHGGRHEKHQKAWIDESNELGYEACFCHGAADAYDVWKRYLDETPE